MRYIGQDKETVYLKCGRCDKIYAYEKLSFDKRENCKCPECNRGGRFIWCYPLKRPKALTARPVILMAALSIAIMFILLFPFFQRSYVFNKAVTSLNPLVTSVLLSVACSLISFDFFKRGPKDSGEGGGERVKWNALFFVVAECIALIFLINIVMQLQYCSLELDNPDTGEVQQYFGSATGENASGTGRLFNSQGKLVYTGGFSNNLFDGYGKKYELVNTVRNTDTAQSYRCVYEGFYKNGRPDGEGREYRYDAEYTFEKSPNLPPNLRYEGAFQDGKYCGYGVLYNLESKYEGVFFDGEFNGYGNNWFLDSGDKKIYKIVGNYLNGRVHGAGKKYYPDGTVLFDGNYEKGRSVSGTSYFDDGSIRYTGEWDGNNYDGNGKLYWQSGQLRYDGNWTDNKRNGSGTSFREDGTMEYIGSWSDDKYSGYGKLYYEDGTTLQYDGWYSGGVRSGNGTEYYRDKTMRYSGNWDSGKWDGQGTWYWENGKEFYIGAFKGGKSNGYGTLHSEDGTISYIGNIENEVRTGTGTSYDSDGNKIYEGGWRDNMRDGQGTSYWSSGNIEYEGGWRDNMRDGQGTSYWSSGSIEYEGGWQEGLYSGQGRLYDEYGNLLNEGVFSDGEFVSSQTDE